MIATSNIKALVDAQATGYLQRTEEMIRKCRMGLDRVGQEESTVVIVRMK